MHWLLQYYLISEVIILVVSMVAILAIKEDINKEYLLIKKSKVNTFDFMLQMFKFLIPVLRFVIFVSYLFAYDEVKEIVVKSMIKDGLIEKIE